jgi:hypothetical protein
MFISLYYISCHQLRVYKDHYIINHDVFTINNATYLFAVKKIYTLYKRYYKAKLLLTY